MVCLLFWLVVPGLSIVLACFPCMSSVSAYLFTFLSIGWLVFFLVCLLFPACLFMCLSIGWLVFPGLSIVSVYCVSLRLLFVLFVHCFCYCVGFCFGLFSLFYLWFGLLFSRCCLCIWLCFHCFVLLVHCFLIALSMVLARFSLFCL